MRIATLSHSGQLGLLTRPWDWAKAQYNVPKSYQRKERIRGSIQSDNFHICEVSDS